MQVYNKSEVQCMLRYRHCFLLQCWRIVFVEHMGALRYRCLHGALTVFLLLLLQT